MKMVHAGSVHMMATLGPMSEAIFSVRHAGARGESAFRDWRKHLLTQEQCSPVIADALQTLRLAPSLTWLLAPVGSLPRNSVSQRVRPGIEAAIEQLTQFSIMPYWRQMLSYLQTQRKEKLKATSMAGGNMLNHLHPAIGWDGEVLEIDDGQNLEMEYHGEGLLVAPCLFLGNRPAVLLRNVRGTDGRPVLLFSVVLAQADARRLWGVPAADGEAVDALIGRTRAQLLRLTLTGGTTSELARRVGTSPAAVSQHTSVLRRAGLIRSDRDRNTVKHQITTLGRAVLDGLTDPDDADGEARVSTSTAAAARTMLSYRAS